MITISHTHADGTLVHGTDRGDGTAAVLKAARFRWFPSIKLWGIPQSRDHLAKRWQIDGAADALRKACFDVAVEIDDTPRDVSQVKADRAERLEDRQEALQRKAERTMTSAVAHERAASEIAERRPFGQPILVGHYSERGARADQRRIERHMDKFCEEYGKARHYGRAASVVGKADAYRERPAVIVRRIEKAEADLRRTLRTIAGETYREKPAGEWLESLEARRVFLEHQLEHDRKALEDARGAGYHLFTRADVHPGDTVWTGRDWSHEVVRVSSRSVSVRTRYTWTDRVSYERITKVDCPHAA